jgi:hypothetical protein
LPSLASSIIQAPQAKILIATKLHRNKLEVAKQAKFLKNILIFDGNKILESAAGNFWKN